MLIQDLQIIIKVAEFRSITAAAEHLDMRTATASAAVKRVEKALGMDLFIRTTRSLRLSSAGEKYIPECQQALSLLAQAKQNLMQDQGCISGELRVGVASDLGRNLVSHWLDDFMMQHQAIQLTLNISDSHIDFYRDPVDVALRYGSPESADLYGFKICTVPRVLCAAPNYLQTHGTPTSLEDLQRHTGLFYQLQDRLHNEWQFSHGKAITKVKMQGNRACNDGDMVRRWCVAGYGFAVKSALDMAEDLLAQRVVSVLPDFQPCQTELWLITPGRQSITPALRLLRDSFREKSQHKLQQLVTAGILSAEAIKD